MSAMRPHSAQLALSLDPDEWRQVPGFPHLEASASGQIRSNGWIKKASIAGVGYPVVRHGLRVLYIHRLVAMAFHGLPAPGQQVNHRNGNKLDNRPANLEWVSPADNLRHARMTGLGRAPQAQIGAAHWASKLTESDVLAILSSSLGPKRLADRYGVSKRQICKIRSGGAWRHLPRLTGAA